MLFGFYLSIHRHIGLLVFLYCTKMIFSSLEGMGVGERIR
jgi:hypothetical protein